MGRVEIYLQSSVVPCRMWAGKDEVLAVGRLNLTFINCEARWQIEEQSGKMLYVSDAQHQVHLALPFPGGDYGAVVGPPRCSPPPPRPPLRVHPSPTCEDRRRIVTVKRKAGFQPSFSQLDGEGEDSPPPACQYTRPAGPATWDHPVCNHCERCGKCPSLCIGHSGCDCDRYDFDCDVCHCSRYVRYSNPSWTSPAKDFSK